MEEKKKGNVGIAALLILIIGLIIVIMVLAITIIKLKNEKEVSSTSERVSNNYTQNPNNLDTLDNTIERIESVEEKLAEITRETEEKMESKVEEKNQDTTVNGNVNEIIDKIWDGSISSIDYSNLNNPQRSYGELSELSSLGNNERFKVLNGNVSISLNTNARRVLKGESLENLGYTDFSENDGFSSYIELNGVSGVKSVACATIGQDFSGESPVLFLMNDGTVKYEKYINVVRNEISLKQINGLNNIVKLYSASVGEIIGGQPAGGYMTTVAVNENGVAFDLGDYLEY